MEKTGSSPAASDRSSGDAVDWRNSSQPSQIVWSCLLQLTNTAKARRHLQLNSTKTTQAKLPGNPASLFRPHDARIESQRWAVQTRSELRPRGSRRCPRGSSSLLEVFHLANDTENRHYALFRNSCGFDCRGHGAGAADSLGQCGGNGWTGQTTCVGGSYCRYQDEWYSQCRPGTW